ncbi:Ferric siderophore transport system, periplasmic binding protein TonB [Nitrospina watsonii]|uniref:Ferric siderophore transport system, periplasmic binding protein TonB n=2 Tax=Nitrospina watsonii TaxID=1323948 RepID=A0ABM9HAE3_9BACT|nr:Ferric siderophore transport system, periplasmic binding protein TonB [Nitrospina watsonii]
MVHLMVAWVIWQQNITFHLEPKPEPKIKVHVASKPPPPPPPPPAQTQPEALKPVAQQPVTPPQKTVNKKPLKPPVPKPMQVVQTQQVKPKVPPPPVNTKPIQQEVTTPQTQTPTFARAIRHTTVEASFKTPVSTVPVQSKVAPTTAVLKTPVTPEFTPKTKTVKMQTVDPDALIEEAAEPIQTASLNTPTPNKTGPVKMAKISGNGPDLQKALDQFNNAIWGQILKAKFYPKMARMRRLEGQPVVKFTIERDGSLSQITINNSSNHEILDSAALKTIQNAAPFPGIPEILNEDRMVLEVPISFILNK